MNLAEAGSGHRCRDDRGRRHRRRAGQAAWMDGFLSATLGRREIERVFYFYPEYFRGMSHGDVPDLESSGLFRSDREVQPAMRVIFR